MNRIIKWLWISTSNEQFESMRISRISRISISMNFENDFENQMLWIVSQPIGESTLLESDPSSTLDEFLSRCHNAKTNMF